MKKTKKLLACLIAAATMFTMGSTAFAAEADATPVDQETVTIHKQYKLIGEGTSPEETFTLEQVGSGKVTDGDAESAPHLGTITGALFTKGAATASGITKDITIELPTYEKVGVYEYTLHEVNRNNAGVTYYENNIKLVVTVIQGENGKLRIAAVHTEAANGEKKVVTGNLGDKEKLFDVTVTLKNNTGKTMASDISYTAGGKENTIKASDWDGTTVTKNIQLKNDQTITFTNLPFGVEYVVTEADYTGNNGGYDAPKYEYKNNDKKISVADQSVTITNNKNSDNIDTGINLTTLPYILVFAGVIVIAGAAFITRRRKYED